MRKRKELDAQLRAIVPHVYYQPPPNSKIDYPAVIYHSEGIESVFADDRKYRMTTRYQVLLIDKDPDSDYLLPLLEIPMSSQDRPYTKDNLNYYPITIYL